MNDTIETVLREHADDDVHIEHLLTAVHAGVRRRRQRRAVLTGAALIVVAALAGVTGATPAPRTVSPGAGWDVAVARPPVATGQPTAAKAPHVLGESPSLFHLDVVGSAVPADWSALSWSSQRGREELLIDTQSSGQLMVEVDHDVSRLIARSGESSRLTVRGKAAEATSAPGWYAVRWQPVPGLWAQASSTADLDAAIDLAGRVRLDHVYRCAVPFRLSGPASARLVKCQTTTFVDGRSPAATVWFRVGTAAPEYEVSSYADQPATVTNDTLAGRAVQINHPQPTGGEPLGLEIIYPYGERTGFFWGFYGPDEAALRSAVTGFSPVTSEDPRSWPSSPFG
jgi:hypothetical protein